MLLFDEKISILERKLFV